jgi:hypothetical protein
MFTFLMSFRTFFKIPLYVVVCHASTRDFRSLLLD